MWCVWITLFYEAGEDCLKSSNHRIVLEGSLLQRKIIGWDSPRMCPEFGNVSYLLQWPGWWSRKHICRCHKSGGVAIKMILTQWTVGQKNPGWTSKRRMQGLHLIWKNQVHQYWMGNSWVGRSFAEKDVEVTVTQKWNMYQQCHTITVKANMWLCYSVLCV